MNPIKRSAPPKPISLVMHPDSGAYGPLLKTALTHLVREGFGRLIDWEDLPVGTGDGPLLLLSATREPSGDTRLKDLGITVDFHLAATELGIETGDDGSFSDDDLHLLMDGIRAVCTVSEGPTPGHHCACR